MILRDTTLLIFITCVPGVTPLSVRSADSALNVALIAPDDSGCGTTGVEGCRVSNITPNIDRIASQGAGQSKDQLQGLSLFGRGESA